jgi:uncharacterized protein
LGRACQGYRLSRDVPRNGDVISGRGRGDGRLRTVLYLHGFASSPAGRKVAALSGLLAEDSFRVVAPDLNVPSFEKLDFKLMCRMAVWEMKKQMPAVVVGSSLGALVALEACRITSGAPLVLIAPALGFGFRWLERLPQGDSIRVFHHGEGRDVSIHRRFFEQMAGVDVDAEPPDRPVTVLMGGRDESVPPEIVRAVWARWEASGRLPAGSRYVEIPQGDHGLVDHVGQIAEEIRHAAGRRAGQVASEP